MKSRDKEYSPEKFNRKIQKWSKAMGVKTVFCACILYCTLIADTTPKWVSALIVAALGYLIAPIDLIPDIIFPLGYTDDLATLVALFTGGKNIKAYISPGIIKEAKQKTKSIKAFCSTPDSVFDELVEKWQLIEK